MCGCDRICNNEDGLYKHGKYARISYNTILISTVINCGIFLYNTVKKNDWNVPINLI